MPQHPPLEGVGKEPNSGPSSPRAESTVAGSATGRGGGGGGRGGGSVATSSRGGRRQVHARLLKRTHSPGLLAGTLAGTLGGEFDRNSAGSYLFPASSFHRSERRTASPRSTEHSASFTSSSSSGDLSTHAPTQRHADNDAQREQQQEQEEDRERRLRKQKGRMRAEKEAVASILSDPERHRRAIATGTSNPLHIWDHETAFIKSRYFSDRRLRNEKKYLDQKKQANKFVDEILTPETVASAGTWSHASSGQSPNTPSNGVHKRLLSDFAGNDSDGGNNNDSNNSKSSKNFDGLGSYHLPPANKLIREKNDNWTAQRHCRTYNINALHGFSWDQRAFLPQRQGFFSFAFDLLASPRFWEKLDWTIRGSVFTILPTLILCLEPATTHIFPLPTSVVFLAYWTTQPTFGAGLREIFIVIKGFSVSFLILIIVIAISPGPAWVSLVILFCCLLGTGFIAEQVKRMAAYCFSSLFMQYIAQPKTTGYDYVGKYYATVLIGQAFGLASFLFPYIRWSSENARRYIVITGDAVSLSVHGACCSFWVENSLLERQLHVVRLRQLRHTIMTSTQKAQVALSEMGYEPHSGVYTTRLRTRMAFLKTVFNIVQSLTLVVEQVAANPALIETPMCREFGERIRGELNLIAAAMDSIILRIVDLDNVVSVTDMTAFRLARTRFEEAVSNVRDEVILSNPDYRTDNSDILLGFFLFSVEELMEVIGNFEDCANPPSNLWYLLTFPLRDLRSSWSAFVDLYNAIRIRHSITRRLKEALKLAICILVAAIFQVYALHSSATSPVSGVEIIAFVYRATGGESFHYASGRLLGTVLGSLTGLLSVQIANGHRPTLYGCTLVLTFVGSYVQAAPNYDALGNALANSVVSIVLQYQSENAAIVRIQQTCFAILIYFIVSAVVWPARGRTKVKTGLDISLRMARQATDRLLRNLDLPDSATAVSADVLAVLDEMQKKVTQQTNNIPNAVEEPTLDSVGFPEMPWRMLIGAERKLLVTLYMMRYAYQTFMTSTIADVAGAGGENGEKVIDNADMIGAGPAAATSISVHWVVLHRISPYTHQLSQLFYEAVEVYLLTLSKATFVPTAELTRLRLGMMQCYDRIVAVYIETIQRELNFSDGDATPSDDHSDKEEAEASDSSEAAKMTDNNSTNRAGNEKSLQTARRGSGSGGGGATTAFGGLSSTNEALGLKNVAGFVPPPASTFAPHPTTVGGAADSVDTFRNNNNSMAGIRNNSMRSSKNRTFSSGSFRHSSAGVAETRSSSKKGTGRFSYKLTPEERQRLRDYVLGPNSAGAVNASFFASAAAVAAAAEQQQQHYQQRRNSVSPAVTAPLPHADTNSHANNSSEGSNAGPLQAADPTGPNSARTTGGNLTNQTFAGGFLTNHSMFNRSMFNTTGSFWSRNVSMFDPAILRNAGIVVQEPVHEEPGQQQQQREEQQQQEEEDGSEYGARSTHHSTLRTSFVPHGGRRTSSSAAHGVEGNVVESDAMPGSSGGANDNGNVHNNAHDEVQHGYSDQLSVRSEGDGASLLPSSPQPPLFTGRAPAPMFSLEPAAVEASTGLTVKKSKTAKYAVPSVLHKSMVLPTGASTLRNPETAAAAASLSVSGSRPPPASSSRSVAAPSASRADAPTVHGGNDARPATHGASSHSPNSTLTAGNSRSNNNISDQSFVSAGAGTAAAAGGDVFALSRAARATPRPGRRWSMVGLTGGAHKSAKDDRDKRDRVPHFAEESLHNQLSLGGWDREGESGGDGGNGWRRRRGSSRVASDAPTAAPSTAAASPPSAFAGGVEKGAKAASTSGREPASGGLLSRDSHEPFEVEMDTKREGRDASSHNEGRRDSDAEVAVLDAVGSGLLSDPLQARAGGTTRERRLSTAPENLLPSPIPAPGAGDLPAGDNGATRPFFNNSFTATGGPAIPDVLRNYVEGLAEQQRQQVPPPPAVLGNMSFINVTANMPVMSNRSFLGGNNLHNDTFAGPGGGAAGGLNNSNPAQANSGSLPSGNVIASASPAASRAAAAAPPATSNGSFNQALRADFMSAVSSLEFNNGTFCGPFRGNGRSGVSGGAAGGGGGEALLNLLDIRDTGGDSDGDGDQYVLTNTDIHSLEAFLFGLRAVITQVEELERYLLEVVHGNEMAAKL